jgi:hypothetical protein
MQARKGQKAHLNTITELHSLRKILKGKNEESRLQLQVGETMAPSRLLIFWDALYSENTHNTAVPPNSST